MYNATSYNHAYNDTGLFCINASAPPSSIKDMIEVVVKELVKTQSSMSPVSKIRFCCSNLHAMDTMYLVSACFDCPDLRLSILFPDLTSYLFLT